MSENQNGASHTLSLGIKLIFCSAESQEEGHASAQDGHSAASAVDHPKAISHHLGAIVPWFPQAISFPRTRDSPADCLRGASVGWAGQPWDRIDCPHGCKNVTSFDTPSAPRLRPETRLTSSLYNVKILSNSRFCSPVR